jgi:RNA polymerase sigma-70 factor (ECF subfamily)
MDPDRRRQIQEWIVRFADGDRGAFQPLFHALWPVVLAFASKGLEPQADAEDAAQQAMLKVFSRIVDFDRSRDGLSWALGIAGFEVMTVRKQRSRRQETGPAVLADVADDGGGVEEQVIAEELRSAVVALVGDLSERDQAALAHAFRGEPPPTDERSRKQKLRALERLRAAWRKVHG